MGQNVRKSRRKEEAGLVRLPCACATLRRTARLVTQLYEEVLRPTGVGGPQFTLLQALHLAPGVSQKELGEILGIDSTTLTRTLSLLRKHGWLRAEPGADRRALRLGLTKAGEKEYERVLPYWQQAQKRLKQVLGESNWHRMIEAVENTASAVQ